MHDMLTYIGVAKPHADLCLVLDVVDELRIKLDRHQLDGDLCPAILADYHRALCPLAYFVPEFQVMRADLVVAVERLDHGHGAPLSLHGIVVHRVVVVQLVRVSDLHVGQLRLLLPL